MEIRYRCIHVNRSKTHTISHDTASADVVQNISLNVSCYNSILIALLWLLYIGKYTYTKYLQSSHSDNLSTLPVVSLCLFISFSPCVRVCVWQYRADFRQFLNAMPTENMKRNCFHFEPISSHHHISSHQNRNRV